MFENLLEKIAIFLSKHQIPYMIIGGQAVLVYGEPRLTKDIDLTLGIGPDRWEEIKSIAEKAGLEILPENPRTFVQETFVLPAAETRSGIRVDFIFSVTPYEQQAIQKTISIKIGKTRVKFARLEDVVIHKIFAGRPRDMEDVKNILLKNPDFDKTYILNWLKEFDNSLDMNLTKRFLSLLNEIN